VIRWILAVAGCLAGLSACGASPRPAPKVLIVGIDGVRPDRLAATSTPALDSLIAHGAFSDRATTRPPTVSGPGWSSMLTGVWADKHGVVSNDFTTNAYGRFPDLLTRLERLRPALATLAVLDWPPLGTTADGGPLVSDAVDRKVLFDGDALGYDVADSLTADTAAALLAATDVDAAFVYLGNVDEVGHAHGTFSPEYAQALTVADREVARILAALHRRPSWANEDWLVLVSTDHGRRDDGGHGGTSDLERTIFVIASGPSVHGSTFDRPPEIVDVAATALAHLGVPIDSAWELDGRPLGLGGRGRREADKDGR
jgi:predicted AlkP superfamily pyrophosphatase or phosphodiesterase